MSVFRGIVVIEVLIGLWFYEVVSVHVALAFDEHFASVFEALLVVPLLFLQHGLRLFCHLDLVGLRGAVHSTRYIHRVSPDVEVELARSNNPLKHDIVL